jgi:hypothetical protein
LKSEIREIELAHKENTEEKDQIIKFEKNKDNKESSNLELVHINGLKHSDVESLTEKSNNCF